MTSHDHPQDAAPLAQTSPTPSTPAPARPQRAFCVLLEEWLYLYTDEDFSASRGRIRIGSAESLISPSTHPDAPTPHSLEIADCEHTTVLCAESISDVFQWVQQLRHLIDEAARMRHVGGGEVWVRPTSAAQYVAQWRTGNTPMTRKRESKVPKRPPLAAPHGAESSKSSKDGKSSKSAASSKMTSVNEESTKRDGRGLTLVVGENYEPLPNVGMRQLGASLVPLRRKRQNASGESLWATARAFTNARARDGASGESLPKDEEAETAPPDDGLGPAMLGVVCEVRLQRGGRQLTVKSCVEILNDTDVPMQLAMGDADGGFVVPPGKARALPLHFTWEGSDEAIQQLKIRPSGGYEWRALVPNAVNTASVSCPPVIGKGSPWMCNARIDFLPLARSVDSTLGATHTRRERAQLRYFNLPSSETLLHYYSCFRLSSSGRPQARCLLYLTPGWLCVYETLGGAAEKMRWEDIDQMHACALRQTVVPSSIELVLKSGRLVIFGALLQREGAQHCPRRPPICPRPKCRPRRVVVRAACARSDTDAHEGATAGGDQGVGERAAQVAAAPTGAARAALHLHPAADHAAAHPSPG